ncbi:Topoisomerase I damage affected protein 4 [Saccharomyces cerevisiae]|jgi:hypothetical protein|nr:Tda4p [Saccharomyces cerevisiae YJM689]AJR55360.1 Tda4p [Saccharomyces cerevisiae YJM693]AJR63873.1 Tda4p [Saccharomyces cerevisiae YJM456]AJR64198.1 Tda4p [Saccharomyces cerevisiae YJM470]AJR66724.1 Tda4p [Saccharomyces cerevisiae YJM1208]AJR69282.1 Tda4p [Saccharomyces cerevisiae YJM1418]AJR69611.1 Tda4p [Saccharomyces cerevisiae YJM1419]AJR70277.1 Tda4p [Saccharomyces cerevisiae YJM1434]AJR70936.1 Tda4p [Saccharomyces cerevisiae YJM1443]AJR72234.1 Tda4p [Saccharomyces cerevisiae YJM1
MNANSTTTAIGLTSPFEKLSFFPHSSNLILAHLHEIIFSFVFYQLAFSVVAPFLNKVVFRKHYTTIRDPLLKIDFDVHTVSMIQAVVSNTVLLPTLTTPMHYNVVTYTDSYSSMVSSLSAGYFIWDLTMCVRYFKLYGLEFTGHAIGSVYVMLLSLRPFCQPWIGRFLIYEASTPFVNINWFIMQCNAKSKNSIPLWFNVVNGLLLMTVFFVVRICWGSIASALLFRQMWKVRDELPKFSAVTMMSLNIFMNLLNVLWFKKMIRIAKKLAKPAPTSKLD